jgi:hypothetical protein
MELAVADGAYDPWSKTWINEEVRAYWEARIHSPCPFPGAADRGADWRTVWPERKRED